MIRSPLHQQVDTLPDLALTLIDNLVKAVRHTITPELSQKITRVFLTGCGDSHHAALNAELAFEQLAGLPGEPMTAMQFARYAVGYLPETGRGSNLVLAISVSGAVSRTVEAMALAHQAGTTTIALTGNPNGPLGQAAELVLETAVPPRECFSPLLTCLPGTLFAAYRAQLLGEPFFRAFGGGRSVEGGGGISRIRDSQQIDEIRR